MKKNLAWEQDLELAKRALEGNDTAVESFVQRMRCIPRFLSSKNSQRGRPLSNDELADLAQEVFCNLWSKLDQFAGRGSLESWTYQFCTLTLMDAVKRKHGVRSQRIDLDPVDAVGLTERRTQEAFEPLEQDRLYSALDSLPEDEQVVVRMKLFDGAPFDEIGYRLRLSPSTAKTRYYRAMGRLKQKLDSLVGEEAN